MTKKAINAIKSAEKYFRKLKCCPGQLGTFLFFGQLAVMLNVDKLPYSALMEASASESSRETADDILDKVFHAQEYTPVLKEEYCRLKISDILEAARADDTKIHVGDFKIRIDNQYADARIIMRAHDIVGKTTYLHEEGTIDFRWVIEPGKKYAPIVVEGENGSAIIMPLLKSPTEGAFISEAQDV